MQNSEIIDILLVEDLQTDAELCEREVRKVLPKSRFTRVETSEGFLAALETCRPGMIISDYKLPMFDGMAALKLALAHVPDIPFLVLTGSMNEETAVDCMKAGAWDYIIKEHMRRLGPAVLSALKQQKILQERRKAEGELIESEILYRNLFENHAAVKLLIDPDTGSLIDANQAAAQYYGWPREELKGMRIQQINILYDEAIQKNIEKVKNGQQAHFEYRHKRADGSIRDVAVFSSRVESRGKIFLHSIIHDITDHKEAAAALLDTMERLRRLLAGTVQTISRTVEIRDPYTAGHQRRTADLARAIAGEMGFSADNVDFVRIAATIHDIGKIAVPAEILSKPTKLTEIEFSLIRVHSQAGHDILKDVEFPWPVASVVLQHHEQLDGSGYPGKLKGEEIMIEARILHVADVVEAMASHRPYRPGLGIAAALGEIEQNSGLLYDSAVANACLKLFRKDGYNLLGS